LSALGRIRILKDKVCLGCGKTFRPYDSLRKYCSFSCFCKDGKTRRKGKILKCKICGKEFYERKSHSVYRKCCSYKCSAKSQEYHMTIKCKNCGKEVKKHFSQKKWRGANYCSNECKWNGMRTKTAKKRSLDALWSKIIRLRANNKCEYCGDGTKQLHAHHLFSRNNLNTRWTFENGMCLCASHHRFGNFSAHMAPLEFSDWIKEKIGMEMYELLKIKSKQIANVDFVQTKDMLTKELDRLTEEKKAGSSHGESSAIQEDWLPTVRPSKKTVRRKQNKAPSNGSRKRVRRARRV
jgi:hypothetical protein